MEERWEEASSALTDDEERRVLFAALDSFRQYRRAAHFNITHRRRQKFYALPEEEWKMLAAPPFDMLAHFDRVDDAIDANADIAAAILSSGLKAFGIPEGSHHGEPDWHGCATPADIEKAKSTLRQFFRDWSHEGATEREACYSPVLADLKQLFPKDAWNRTKVLIPGAGLGRLVFEICQLGFTAEGNEISFHQLISSNWILNQVHRDEKFCLYPFTLGFSNHLKRSNQLRCVNIPDVHPGTQLAASSQAQDVHAFERMTMTAADFVVLYSDEEHRGMFDAVVTVFFIDTAPNLIRYLQTIWNALKPGGYWINLGPLLWHFEDRAESPGGEEHGFSRSKTHRQPLGIAEDGGVELALDDVIHLIERTGFHVQWQEVLQPGASYIQDPASMLVNHYACAHFVAQRTT